MKIRNKTVFVYDFNVSVENPKEFPKLLEVVNDFSKVAGDKVHIQNSVTSLNTSKKRVEFEIKNTKPFTLALPKGNT